MELTADGAQLVHALVAMTKDVSQRLGWKPKTFPESKPV